MPMLNSERAAAQRCAKVLTEAAVGLAPLASSLDALAEMLIELSYGRPISDELKGRYDESWRLVETIDYRAIKVALAAGENLIGKVQRRGG